MSEVFLTQEEHNEFVKRMESANGELDRRISTVEKSVDRITGLTISVERIANSIDALVKEQEKQGEKLEAIEKMPAKRWDTLVVCIITGLVSALISVLMSGFIH